MKYSKLFAKTIKTVSGDVVSKSHELLVRGGFVHQEMAGIFTWLPLGRKVLTNIENIIRDEMNKIDGQEITMPALEPKENWLTTGRWDKMSILFKVKSTTGKEYALGPTHEEIVTPLVASYIKSYRDLPIFLYQIQTKFRDEPRAKSGVIRGREFGMKDLYSFHVSHDDLLSYYNKVKQSYLKIFKRCGLDAKVTEASGGDFTKTFSHEFMVVSEAGEDSIIYCPVCDFCQNKEIAEVKVGDKCPKCGKILAGAKAIEVGNIFDLGDKYSQAFNLFYTAKDGSRNPVIMGCYGMGTTRLVGAIVEVCRDQVGIVWPEEVSPYKVHLIKINNRHPDLDPTRHPEGAERPKDPSGNQGILRSAQNDGEKTQNDVNKKAEEIYKKLLENNIEVLFDDREDTSVGQKFSDADLIGIPVRIVVSERTLEKDSVEVKRRNSEKIELVNIGNLLTFLK